MREALVEFTKHENIRAFMYEVLNGNVNEFIQVMSSINGQNPHDNACDLRDKLAKYLYSIYNVQRHFGSQKKSTFSDYIHQNVSAPRMGFEFLISDLQKNHNINEIQAMMFPVLMQFQSTGRTGNNAKN